MLRYMGSGLPDIYLTNGYRIRRSAYGETIAIADVTGLHRAIAREVVATTSILSAEEFRYLRKELELSQKRVAVTLGVEEQTVSLWERGKTVVPTYADVFLRALMRECLSGNAELQKLVEEISETDRVARDDARREFSSSKVLGWTRKRAA